jgi:hypothetical protein
MIQKFKDCNERTNGWLGYSLLLLLFGAFVLKFTRR